MRKAAATKWSRELGRVAIDGAPDADRRIFYTALYHNFLAPSIFSDVDGAYRGFDEKPHHVPIGHSTQYSSFSDWDIYRGTAPFQTLIFPERAADTRQALHYMILAATVPSLGKNNTEERAHLGRYMKFGYIPDATSKSVPWDISASETLEFTNDDFAIGTFAKAIGDRVAADTMLKRAGNWHSLLDPETHWIRPREPDGQWIAGFDAEKSLPHAGDTPVPTDQLGFQEGNTYQYTFMVPFDYAGLFRFIGNDQEVERRLDRFFQKLV